MQFNQLLKIISHGVFSKKLEKKLASEFKYSLAFSFVISRLYFSLKYIMILCVN